MDRSNERYSRTPRGAFSLLLQLLQPGGTIGVLGVFCNQHYRPSASRRRQERAKFGLPGRTENPRRVRRSRDIPDRRRSPIPSERGVHQDYHTSHKCSELVPHREFVVKLLLRSGVGRTEGIIRPPDPVHIVAPLESESFRRVATAFGNPNGGRGGVGALGFSHRINKRIQSGRLLQEEPYT